MLSLIIDYCLACKSLTIAEDEDNALSVRRDLAETMHNIMTEANSEVDISPELFERHFNLTVLRADTEHMCFECLENHQRKGALWANYLSKYLLSVSHSKTKLEIVKKSETKKVVKMSSYKKRVKDNRSK